MALHIKGNRILSDEEYYNEEGSGVVALLVIALFLSPGIILTSFIHPFFLFTTGQLWASVIIGSIIVMILMYFFTGLSVSRFLICSGLCAGFIFLFTLCSSDNIFWNTTKALFEAGPYVNKGDKTEKTDTSKDGSAENCEGNITSFSESAYMTPNTEDLIEEETSINEQVDDNDIDSNELASQNDESIQVEQDCKPSFPGGNDALLNFVMNNMKYPVIAKENGIEGTVKVEFDVDYDGLIKNVVIAESADPLLDAEAIRIIESMPKWNVGRKDGKPVCTTLRYPIKFKIS